MRRVYGSRKRGVMKSKELKKRAAALLLGISVAASQLLTGQLGVMTVRAATTQDVQDAEESQQDTDASGGQDVDTQEPGINQALLLYLDDDPLDCAGDAQALKHTLSNTNQFDESVITTYMVPQDSDEDAKTEIWNKISDMAAKTGPESFTVIAYFGHGGSNMDGTSYLAAGGANNISAAELRNHLDELQGKVLVMLACCYSNGMIMTASEFDDGEETGNSSFSDTSFINEFMAQEYSGGKENTEEASSKDSAVKKEDKEKTEKATAKTTVVKDAAGEKTSSEKASSEAANSEKTSEKSSEDSAASKEAATENTSTEAADAEKSSADSAASKETEEKKSESSETSGAETSSVQKDAAEKESAAEEETAEQSTAENTTANESSEEEQITKSVEDNSAVIKKVSIGKVKTAMMAAADLSAAGDTAENGDAGEQNNLLRKMLITKKRAARNLRKKNLQTISRQRKKQLRQKALRQKYRRWKHPGQKPLLQVHPGRKARRKQVKILPKEHLCPCRKNLLKEVLH